MQPEVAGKITSMLLEEDNDDLLPLLADFQKLTAQANEALKVLQPALTRESQGTSIPRELVSKAHPHASNPTISSAAEFSVRRTASTATSSTTVANPTLSVGPTDNQPGNAKVLADLNTDAG